MADSWYDDLGSGIQSTAKSVYNWGSNQLTPAKPDLSESQGANQRAQSAVGAYGDERANYQPLTAPQIGGGSSGGAPPAAYGAPAPTNATGAPTASWQRQPAGTNPRPQLQSTPPTAPSGHGRSFTVPPAGSAPPGAPPAAPATNASLAGAYAQPATSPFSNQGQQQDALAMLRGAANGTAPSAAEIQSGQQLGTAMANQYAMASGLQGRHPGAAYDAAARGAAQVQGNVIGEGQINRANEQANARNAYAQTVGGARGQDIQTDVANLNAKLTTMGYDQQTRNALLAAQLQAQGYDVATANAIIGAQTSTAESANKFKGGLIGGAGSAIAALA